jgi:hypothetical protein
VSWEKYRKKAFMINKIITNVVLGSTFLGGGMIGLTTHLLATAESPEQPNYEEEATEHLKVLRWDMDLKKCMEFLNGEGKNANPNVSVGTDLCHSYIGITLLEEAILHGSLEDVRMLVSNKNVRGIDLGEVEGEPQDRNHETYKLDYGHTLMHIAVASPQEMEKCWDQHFRATENGRRMYANLLTKYPGLIPTKAPSSKDRKPSDLHASEEIVQFLIDAFKEYEKEWVVLDIDEKNPIHNRHKKTTPLDLVKDYLKPENVKNYTEKERESYEKHKEEYMHIRDLLQKTKDDISESGGSTGYQNYKMSLH